MKTTFDLPESLVDEIKRRALKEGRDESELVAELLAAGLPNGAESSIRNGQTVPKTLPRLKVRPVESGENPPRPSPSPRLSTDPQTGFPLILCDANAPAIKMSAGDLIAIERELEIQADLERLGLPH